MADCTSKLCSFVLQKSDMARRKAEDALEVPSDAAEEGVEDDVPQEDEAPEEEDDAALSHGDAKEEEEDGDVDDDGGTAGEEEEEGAEGEDGDAEGDDGDAEGEEEDDGDDEDYEGEEGDYDEEEEDAGYADDEDGMDEDSSIASGGQEAGPVQGANMLEVLTEDPVAQVLNANSESPWRAALDGMCVDTRNSVQSVHLVRGTFEFEDDLEQLYDCVQALRHLRQNLNVYEANEDVSAERQAEVREE